MTALRFRAIAAEDWFRFRAGAVCRALKRDDLV